MKKIVILMLLIMLVGLVACDSQMPEKMPPQSKDEPSQAENVTLDYIPVLQPSSGLQWYKTFGQGEGNSVQQTADGGYIVCGTTVGFMVGGRGTATPAIDFADHIYLAKTDADGKSLWDKKFDAKFSDQGFSVHQTTDDGYIVCGITNVGDGNEHIRLLKTDTDGNICWDKKFDAEFQDQGRSVQQTTDGGYIICGETNSLVAHDTDVLLIKTDSDGNQLWDKTFGRDIRDSGYSVQQTFDGGYIVCGSTTLPIGTDSAGHTLRTNSLWLIKTDSAGNRIWDRIFEGEKGGKGNSVQQTKDGGYIICGNMRTASGGSDIWLVKTDTEGNRLWDRTFGGKGANEGFSVQQTTDGGYVICGETNVYGAGDRDLWLIKTDAEGNKLWDKTFGGYDLDLGRSAQQTADGGYVACGRAKFYILLLKIAPVTEQSPQH